MILVTGATGTVGSEVVRQLLEAGVVPRILARHPEKLAALRGRAEIHAGDLDAPETLRKAMAGVERLFLSSAGLEGPARERHPIEAAAAAGVRHVVKLSVMGAEYESITFARWHRASEKLLEASSMDFTFLRPGSFSSNALGWADTIRRDGAIYLPTADGRSAVIDPADIAAVAVKALTTTGHEKKVYVLSGPEALTVGEQAAILGRHLGRTVKHVDVPVAGARQAMLAAGIPEAYVDGLLELHAATRAGQTAMVTHTVEELLGRPAASFDDYVARHLAQWR